MESVKILGIETSCDETAIAVVENGKKKLFNLIYSQIDLHKEYFGVVPEIASRAHLEKINLLLQEGFNQSNLSYQDMDAVAVSNRPGLVGSLMTGVGTAKVISSVFQKPLIGINHVLAHLYSNFLVSQNITFPFIGLVVSGGHTLLLKVEAWDKVTIKGTTIDDAVGEAFDKVAKMLNLTYPGGPIIDKLAEQGNEAAISFPKITMYNKKRNNYNFSYSGLKTSVLYYLKKQKKIKIEDVCASFQKSAIDVLYDKTIRLANSEKINKIVIAGGVAANSYLRKLFLGNSEYQVFLPPKELCTDNAAMIAGLGYHFFKKKKFDKLDLNVYSKNDIPIGQGVIS